MTIWQRIVPILVIASATFILLSPDCVRAAPAQVVDCHDGDTCTFLIDLGLGVSKSERVRFCDIDAPELKEGEAAAHSRDTLLMLLRSAETLEVIPSGTIYRPRRSFARLLAWVRVDGRDAGELLVAGGLAGPAEKRCRR